MKKHLLLIIILLFSFNIAVSQTISMIGNTSPSGSWSTDTNLTTSDNITYTLNNVTLTTASNPSADGLKFRQDGQWTINWGAASFPSGTGTQGGANIQTVAGTYNVTFNRLTGAYNFSTNLGTVKNSLNQIKIYPNPSHSDWNISTSNDVIQSIELFDILGKRVLAFRPNATNALIDGSNLNDGVYFVKIETESAKQTIKVVKY